MASARNIQPIDSLIGMTIISRATGNKLGQVHDLVVDPVEGVLLGLSAQAPDGNIYGIEYGEIYNFGPDAVMVNADDSLSSLEGSPLVGPPLAKKNLAGAKIITESGKLLGSIANVFFHSSAPPFVVYEVRESLLDKLLGRAMFIPASAGRAMSEG
ncbi:MAG: PRC-barrel domain-containing protein, partial [Pyrinomonadaceae bacterium]